MHVRVRNVNEALFHFVAGVHNETIEVKRKPSRYGKCLVIPEPVMITYTAPLERVCFNPGRDCNPFFHLVESLWILAGKNDVATLKFFVDTIDEFSDDGKTFHGAYGHRFRNHWYELILKQNPIKNYTSSFAPEDQFELEPQKSPVDQLAIIIDELRRDPTTRRLVLTMWDPIADLQMLRENPKCKDVPCNTHAYFTVDDGYLDITVCNRSNDLVWGCFGANAVQFSFLLEYVALAVGLKVGEYHQITNNLHIYTNRWDPELLLKDTSDFYRVFNLIAPSVPLLTGSHELFDVACKRFVERCTNPTAMSNDSLQPFIRDVAFPMVSAYHFHKRRKYVSAFEMLSHVKAPDWQRDGMRWINKRRLAYEARSK